MLHEYREEITALKTSDAHFAKIFEKHNELDEKIMEAESGRNYIDEFELDRMKKEKLRLKDEAYAIVLEYRKSKKQ
ncbi:YdcH family protein [Helicobacter sp. 16-1353]|uniref:YdcH family protein n=1 Tax=Helicobacter sp. 16-1353 TaxID=2004996 RepID=UPI0015EED60A|nr:YdcH family protein [Helicobacter sp. 16-1353]